MVHLLSGAIRNGQGTVSSVLSFKLGERAVFTHPETFEQVEFQISTIHRSAKNPSKDLLESKDGFNARAEFCTRK